MADATLAKGTFVRNEGETVFLCFAPTTEVVQEGGGYTNLDGTGWVQLNSAAPAKQGQYRKYAHVDYDNSITASGYLLKILTNRGESMYVCL